MFGWSFEGACMMATRRRRWRLMLAIDGFVRRGCGSGEELSRLVGGFFTFAALVRRGCLSYLHTCYGFTQHRWSRAAPLWIAVIRELRWMRARCLLLEQELDSPWSDEVFCTGASEMGRGVCRRSWGAGLCAQFGRESERRRFSREGERGQWGSGRGRY